jgi:hypothetical protein
MSKDFTDEPRQIKTSPRFSRRPLSGIFQEIGSHLTEILRSEVRLARAEISQDVGQFAKASVLLVAGVVFALYAFGLFLLAAVYALEQTLPAWGAALIVGGGLGAVAAVVFLIGRKRVQQASLLPDKTIQSLQENVTWMKRQTK